MKGKKSSPPPAPELKKGMLLVLKAPPYYTKTYLYEVTSAGDKLVRASLYHSPTVRKSWSKDELAAMFNNDIMRIANEDDLKEMTTGSNRPD